MYVTVTDAFGSRNAASDATINPSLRASAFS